MTFPYPIPGASTIQDTFVADDTHSLGAVNKTISEQIILTVDYSRTLDANPISFSFKVIPGGMPPLKISQLIINTDSTVNFTVSGGIKGVNYTIVINAKQVDTEIRSDKLYVNVAGDSNQCVQIAAPPTTAQVSAGGLTYVNTAPHWYVSSTAPAGATVMDEWYNPSTTVAYEYRTDGVSTWWAQINTPVGEAPTDGFSYMRVNETWESGGTLSGSLTIDGNLHVDGWIWTSTAFYVDTKVGTPKVVYYRTNGVLRWAAGGDGATELGGNIGTNFGTWAYDNNGNQLGRVINIERKSGMITQNGPLNIQPPYANTSVYNALPNATVFTSEAVLNLCSPLPSTVTGSGVGNKIQGYVGTVSAANLVWGMALGNFDDPTPGTPNSGSNFTLTTYDDSGNNLSTALKISRNNSAAVFGGTLSAVQQFNITNPPAGGPVGIRLYSTPSSQIYFQSAVNSALRWGLYLGNGDPEGGSPNAGTNFELLSFDDTGNPLKEALLISRATGLATLVGDPTTPLGAATKQYVDGVAIAAGSVVPSNATPLMDGTATPGTVTGIYAREGHVHPTDTSRAPIASPTFTGTITANGGSYLTLGPSAGYFWYDRIIPGQQWAWYANSGKAYFWSSNFTDIIDITYTTGATNFNYPVTFNGTTQAPTLVSTDNSTNVATTAFVHGIAGSYLPLVGGTLTGNIAIAPVSGAPVLRLEGAASGIGEVVQGGIGGHARWNLYLGDGTTETGTGNTGSNFVLNAYADDGLTFIGQPIAINRASITTTFGGAVNLHADPTVPLGAATKQYVDNSSPVNVAGGFVNKFRNGTMDIWQRGSFVTIAPNSVGYTADGWLLYTGTGAQISVNRTLPSALNGSTESMQLLGVAGANGCTVGQRIEATIAAQLGISNTITFQAQIYNQTGAPFTPQLQVWHPSVVDFGSGWTQVIDIAPVNMQVCPNLQWTKIYYVFTIPNASLGQGIEVDIIFGNALNGPNEIFMTQCDIRATSTLPGTINPIIPMPELRPINTELAYCQRYYETSYGNWVQPGATTPAPGFVQAGLSLGGSVTITYMDAQIWFKVAKRVNNPSLYLWSYNSGTGGLVTSGSGSIAKAYDVFGGVDVQVTLADTNISASHCTVALLQHTPGPAIDVAAGWAVSAEL